MKSIIVLICFAVLLADAGNPLFLSNTIGSNMVLQRAPESPVLWGQTVAAGTKVLVEFDNWVGGSITSDNLIWKIALPPTKAGGPYNISITSSEGDDVLLTNILFGDVFICSGQSNMQFGVLGAFNASEQISIANGYPNIRLFTVGQGTISSTPLNNFATITQNWVVADSASVGNSIWGYFSATCWFFGKDVYDNQKVPIGLISSNWGGTIVQAWSSPDALAKCPSKENDIVIEQQTKEGTHSIVKKVDPNQPSVLWNAMIVPLLPMRIKGVAWYQGENNVGHAAYYSCAFPAMINDWRAKFDLGDMGFFFVQLSPYVGPGTALADLRLAQTAALSLQNVGMATAIDLGDMESPESPIHPRDKEDVGLRLSLAARAMIYGEKIQYKGPAFMNLTVSTTPGTLNVLYYPDSIGSGITTKADVVCPPPYEKYTPKCAGFEIKGSDGNWYQAVVTSSSSASVSITASSLPSTATAVGARYLYQEWPLASVYNKEGLPATPFEYVLPSNNNAMKVRVL